MRRVFGANVMVTVATQLNVPIKILVRSLEFYNQIIVLIILIKVPLWFPEGPSDFTLIGLGDIVLPGLLVTPRFFLFPPSVTLVPRSHSPFASTTSP